MNNLFFACTDCKVYVDAGYRWASWWLEEPGIVKRGKPVSVASVLSAREYWTPAKTDGAQWLYTEVLPSVRRFLEEHKGHHLMFGNTADFLASDGDGLLDWMQVGFLPLLLPRYFVERLGFKTWDQVSNFIARQDSAPWWWMREWDDLHAKVRKKFHELVESGSACKRSLGCKSTSH
ncbi:MAG: hypothetical protein DMF60_18420 [Acidobacteria bacterium]|nr:MAG: hypothetical protein DMF60_18420 [Acidobacteriota bacterium]